MSKKRKCRYTAEGLAIHEEAVRLRKMTDKKLVERFHRVAEPEITVRVPEVVQAVSNEAEPNKNTPGRAEVLKCPFRRQVQRCKRGGRIQDYGICHRNGADMMNEERHYRAVMSGRRSKAAGEHWENMIEAACQHYRLKGTAEITKTPEPMRPIKSLGQGKFIAHYEKMAQPDYKGTLAGGKAIVFEAKHTDGDRLQQSVISSEQEKQLDRHVKLGAECFVMVSFGFKQYFKIPWEIFRDMKQHYGRKYITPEDVQQYTVRYLGGVLHFLQN